MVLPSPIDPQLCMSARLSPRTPAATHLRTYASRFMVLLYIVGHPDPFDCDRMHSHQIKFSAPLFTQTYHQKRRWKRYLLLKCLLPTLNWLVPARNMGLDLHIAKRSYRFAAPAARTTILRKPNRLNDFNYSANLVEQKKELFGTVAMTISAASKQRKHFKERFFACPHHKFAEMNPSVGRSGCAYQGRGFQNMAQLTYVFLFL